MARKAKGKSKAQAPVSTHPAFPAVVALWFAALFGIGSLVLPAILFEQSLAATGVAALQPPIGMTARLVIAVIAACIGIALGLFLARKVAASHTQAEPRTRDFVPEEPQAKKPISAHEELGSEGLDEPIVDDEPEVRAPVATPIPGRRRALSVTDDSGPSEFLDHAPLPGADQYDAVSLDGHAGEESMEEESEMLELGEFEEDNASGENAANAAQPFGTGSLSMSAPAPSERRDMPSIMRQDSFDDATDESRPFDAPARAPSATPPAPFAPPPASSASQAGTARPFDAPGQSPAPAPFAPVESEPVEEEVAEAPVDASPFAELQREIEQPQAETASPAPFAPPVEAEQPAPFAPPAATDEAPALGQKRPSFGMPQPVDATLAVPQAADAAPAPAPPIAPPVAAEPREESAAPVAAEPHAEPARVATGKLADMGMVELVERFALSLQRRGNDADAPRPMPESSIAALAAAAERIPASDVQPDVAIERVAEQPVEAADPVGEQPTAAPVQADPAPPVPRVPAALQPLGYEDEDDDDDGDVPDLGLSFGNSPAPFGRPVEATPAEPVAPAPVAEAPADEDEDDAEGFGSLLAMKSPFAAGREFVRIEDEDASDRDGIEPVVVFPGNEVRRAAPAADGTPRDSETVIPAGAPRQNQGATEQALKDALAKLQKMSGAA